jgi:acyl-CoA synthetase (AMP-forming)/AMP-acid ligase II
MTVPLNVAAHLPDRAAKAPYQLAVAAPAGRDRWGRVKYLQYTYRRLNEVCDHFAFRLQGWGVGRGVRTVLMVPPGLEFFALTFALFKIAAVPILVDPGMGIRNLGKCLAEAQPQAFIGVRKAHIARLLLCWCRKTLQTTVNVGAPFFGTRHAIEAFESFPFPPGEVRAFPVADVSADEMAAILFTSGSTGPAKGAVYSHGIFSTQLEAIRQTFQIQPGEIDLATFPLFALFAPALGMTAVVPDMDPTRPARVDPTKIFEAVRNFGVTNLFGSPALLNRVGRAAESLSSAPGQPVQMDSVRRVVSAGAPVSAAVIERFTRLLPPGTQLFTPYGATEALPVAVTGSDEILKETRYKTDQGGGVCVGRPVSGITVKIIQINDEPIPQWRDELELPQGEIGEIAVSAPWVTRSYFNRPEATALAKIARPDGTVYHRMGDVGYFDESGRLWFCGRKSQRVVTAERTFFTIRCEAVFNTHPSVYRTALVGVQRHGQQEPVLCVELEPAARAGEERIRRELLDIGARFHHAAAIKTILFHPAFPVDIRHNAKIFREKLAVWAAKRLR